MTVLSLCKNGMQLLFRNKKKSGRKSNAVSIHYGRYVTCCSGTLCRQKCATKTVAQSDATVKRHVQYTNKPVFIYGSRMRPPIQQETDPPIRIRTLGNILYQISYNFT